MLAIEYELRSEKFRANLGASGPKRHLGTYTAPAGEDAIQDILISRSPFSRRRGRRRTRSHCGDAHFSNNSGTCAPHVPSDSVAPIRNKTRANRTNLLLHKSNIETSCKRGNPRNAAFAMLVKCCKNTAPHPRALLGTGSLRTRPFPPRLP